MPWVKFDDQFPIHRKTAGLSDTAYLLHESAIFWCARNLTDGYMSPADLDLVCARVRKSPERFAAECVDRATWHLARTPCMSPKCPPPVDKDGWRIHDYFDYQPSKEQVMKDKEAKKVRQKRWLAKKDGSKDASQDGSRDDAPPRPPLTGKRGGETAAPSAANGRASPAGSADRGRKPKPPWCGTCHETTRQVGDPPMRCPRCHPLATGLEAESWQATHAEVYRK